MIAAIGSGLGIAAGGALMFVLGWLVCDLTKRRERRNLASAFVGEIAAVLSVIETNSHALSDHTATDCPSSELEYVNHTLPPLVIYQRDADKITRFAAPLPRKISFLYTRLATLGDHASATEHEYAEIMDLGDDVLRALRPLVSRTRRA